MLVSYNWLKKYIIGRVPPPKKLAEILALHSFEVENVEKRGKDFVLDIDVLPNRASDCLSIIGIAREIKAILDLKLKIPKVKLREAKQKTKDLIDVKVIEKNACPRYMMGAMIGIKIKESPREVREKLNILGLNSINNVVDALNYVMLETGQPLHAFDLDKVEGKKIIVRKAKKREKIKTLDGKEFKLNKNILVIADEKEPLAIAGIKGGRKAEITEDTKNIIIEAANFKPLSIRRARQTLKLQTDASLRFEHNPSLSLVDKGMERALGLLQEVAGGEVARGKIDISSKKIYPKLVSLDLEKMEKLVGCTIKRQEVVEILKRLEFTIKKSEGKKLLVQIPPFRMDISIPEDLIEEIVRIKGYDFIPEVLPKAVIFPPVINDNVYWSNLAKDYLKELGFTEIYNYSFIGEADAKYFKLQNLIEIQNPLSEKQKYLRSCLAPNLLKNVKENFKHYNYFKIFELGKVYYYSPSRKITEQRTLGGLIAKKKEEKEIFFELKGAIDSFLNKLGISDIWYDDFQPTMNQKEKNIWSTYASADVKIGEDKIGFLGKVKDSVLKELGISGEVCFFSFDFEKLQKLSLEEQEYQPISPYPAAVRDIAVLVPRGTKVAEVLNVINESGGPLVRDVDLFDMYEGENLPEGKKNLAFHIIYQAEDHTLTSKEIENLHRKIIKAIESNVDWEVRK